MNWPDSGSFPSKRLFVLAAFVAFAAIFFVFFPPVFVSIDEHEYAKNASLIIQGKVQNADPLSYCGGQMQNGNYQSTYFLGKSILLLPFLPFGISGLMLSGLVLHLVIAFVFLLVLRRLKIDERLVILYLFFPAFLWESRTLFPELAVLLFCLGAVYFYLGPGKRDWFLGGILFGLGTFIRYDAVLLTAGFLLMSLFQNRRRFVMLLAGLLPVGVVVLSLNTILYGGPLQTPYGYSVTSFLLRMPETYFLNFATFAAMLLVAYPLMLLIPFAYRKNLSIEALISAIAVIAFFSKTTDIHLFEFFSPLTVTGRMRYLVPAAGLLLIPYAGFAEEFLKGFSRRIHLEFPRILVCLLALMVAGSAVASFVHQSSLSKRYQVLSAIQNAVPEGSLVVGSSDDCIYFSKELFGDRKYVRVDSSFQDVNQIVDSFAGPAYVMELRYSNQSDNPSRQDGINNERQRIVDFVAQKQSVLEKVFETKIPHALAIYRFTSRPAAQSIE